MCLIVKGIHLISTAFCYDIIWPYATLYLYTLLLHYKSSCLGVLSECHLIKRWSWVLVLLSLHFTGAISTLVAPVVHVMFTYSRFGMANMQAAIKDRFTQVMFKYFKRSITCWCIERLCVMVLSHLYTRFL